MKYLLFALAFLAGLLAFAAGLALYNHHIDDAIGLVVMAFVVSGVAGGVMSQIAD